MVDYTTEKSMAKKRRGADPESQLKRAFSALERGQHRQALRQLERVLPQVEDDQSLAEQAHLAMSDACLSLRELPQAINHALVAVDLNPNSDQAYYMLGFAQSVNQSWELAVEALQRAMELDPDNVEYYRALGWALFNRGDLVRGQSLLEQALEKAPTYIPVLTDLAMLHAKQERYDQAVTYARRAVELAPGDTRTQEVFAVLSHFKSEFERLGGKTKPKQARPTTEAEWRELIARTDNFNELVQLWFELHPAEDLNALNADLQHLQELWNSTPRAELGGRTPNEMMGQGGQ
jgi:tetratricopeptide (TPR) repeat protein